MSARDLKQKEASSPAELALYAAVNQNDLEAVQRIIAANPGLTLDVVAAGSPEANTPLLNALSFEYMDIAHYLLDKGASPWVANNYGITALHMLAMVGKEMTPKKEDQVLTFLKKLMNVEHKKQFSAELNNAVPMDDPRSPLTLSIQYQPAKLMMKFADILLKEGAKYQGRGELWSGLLNSSEPHEKVKYLQQKFPKEFSIEKLKIPSDEFSGRSALLAACAEGNISLTKFFYETEPKFWTETLNAKNGILHFALDNILKGNLKERAEIIYYFLDKGADLTLRQAGTNKNLVERLQELPTKGWANHEITLFAKEVLEKIQRPRAKLV